MTKQKVMALGFFDGIHVGHAALINKIKQRAEETGAEPAVLTFDVHPDNLVFKKTVPLINSAEDRENILSRCFGIDDVVVIPFSQRVMHMDWQDFIDELIDEMNLRWIVVGHDFCFGYKGLGTAEKLKAYCAERGVGCDIIAAVCRDGVVVSSTLIRQLIETGEMEKANEYLGHPHTLTDVIRTGYHLGTKMGTPTINMSFPQGVIIPRHGVYAAKAYIDGNTVGAEYKNGKITVLAPFDFADGVLHFCGAVCAVKIFKLECFSHDIFLSLSVLIFGRRMRIHSST